MGTGQPPKRSNRPLHTPDMEMFLAKRVILFQKPGCQRCNRTRDWLWTQPEVEVYERDLLLMPPAASFLEDHVQGEGEALRTFLNPSSRTYRQQGLAEALPERGRLLELMQSDPSLIRRPLIVRGKRAVFGSNFPAIQKILE